MRINRAIVGAGLVETPMLLIYDIVEDRARFKVSETCLDFGLERIQYSAFSGHLNRNRREELCLRLSKLMEKEKASGCIRVQPICERDFREAWEVEFEDADGGPARQDEHAQHRVADGQPAGNPDDRGNGRAG